MAARSLPDLVARLKLDNSDLQRATQAAGAMGKQIEATASASTAGLKRIQSEAGNTNTHVTRLGTAFASLRTHIGGTTSAMVGFAGPLLGIAGVVGTVYTALDKVVVPAIDFQQQMVKLVGTAGESEAGLKGVSDGILKLSGDVGYGAAQLADGMYLIESAGFHGSAGLDVLRYSAMAAKAENADLATVANATTTALNAYGLGAAQASHVTDVLLAATSQGKMTFQDLAGSLDQILPVASAAKIGLNEVAAAIATQTAQGTPATIAATNLQYAIRGLQVPTSTAASAIEGLGVKSTRFADELGKKGLQATLADLTTLIGKKFPVGSAAYNAAISAILGNQEGLNAVLQLSGTHAKTFATDLSGMGAAAGKTQSAFDEMMATTGGKWSAFTSRLGAEAIGIGTAALPAINQLIDALDKRLTPLIAGVASKVGGVVTGASQVASGQRNVGQVAMTGLEAAGMSPEAAGKIAGPITDIATSVGRLQGAFEALAKAATPALRDLGDLLLRAAPPALDLANNIVQFLVVAIQVVGDHMNVLRPILTALAIGWGLWQTAIFATNVVLWAQTAGIYAYETATVAVRLAVWAWAGATSALNLVQDLNTFALQRGYIGTIVYLGQLVALRVAQFAGAIATGIATAAQWAWNVAVEANPIGLLILGLFALIAIVVLVVTHWDMVTAAVGRVWNWLLQVIQAHAWLQVALTILLGPIVLVISHWNQVIGVLSAVITWFGHTGDAFSALGGVASAVAGGIGAAFSGLGGAIHGGLSAVGGVLDRFDDMVNHLPVIGGILSLPRIPAFAEGGIVNRPTVGLFGEAGPEALIPLGGGAEAIDLWRQAGDMLGMGGLDVGSIAGQCVAFVQQLLGVAFRGNANQWVNAPYPHTQTAMPGEIAVFTGGEFGHVAVVTGFGDGYNFPVIDSNWTAPLTVGRHTMNKGMYGFSTFLAPGVKLPSGMAGVDRPTDILNGLVAGALGGLGGWQRTMANGLVGKIIGGVASRFDDGGVWHSGTLGANTSGRDEYVLTRDQMAAMAGGGISVTVNGATLQPLDERRIVSMLREAKFLYG